MFQFSNVYSESMDKIFTLKKIQQFIKGIFGETYC